MMFFVFACSSKTKNNSSKTQGGSSSKKTVSNSVKQGGKNINRSIYNNNKSSNKDMESDNNKNNIDCAKKLAKAYEDYHFWRLDKALLEVDDALKIIDGYYNQKRDMEVPDKDLKIKKAYKVKSTAHLLRGLILIRKASDYNRISRQKGEKVLKEYLQKHKEAEKMPPMKIYEKIKGKIGEIEKRYYKLSMDTMKLAREEFKKALDIDPDNPDAHYHYAKKVLLASGDKSETEKELYKSAMLYIKEGDRKKVRDILKEIKKVNIGSIYINKIEEVLKDEK